MSAADHLSHKQFTDLDTLKDIERRDPDGSSPTQPTAADYKAHKTWAVNKHGKDAWNDYRQGGWYPQYGDPDGGSRPDSY